MAEGFALKIHEGDVPELFKNFKIYALDLGGLLAGTKFRGDFEQRLKGVISALMKKEDAVLFIDEIHTIVGAGATSGGTMDASNILKPALSSGDLRVIGSTTYEEYKNHFEKDRALSRRFEKIEISEPTESESYRILKGLRSRYEAHHDITYTEPALKSAVSLSSKYLNDRYLPDKAIDVIDEAGAYIRISGGSRRQENPSGRYRKNCGQNGAYSGGKRDHERQGETPNPGRPLKIGDFRPRCGSECPSDSHQAFQGRLAYGRSSGGVVSIHRPYGGGQNGSRAPDRPVAGCSIPAIRYE